MPLPAMHVHIENFKSLWNVDVDLRPGLNILIGPNGSGKTNLLSALKFVRDFLLHGAARAVAFAGGPRSVYNRETEAVIIRVTTVYGVRIVRRRKAVVRLAWEFAVTQSSAEIPVIRHERMTLNASREDEQIELLHISRHPITGKQEKSLPTEEVAGRDLFDGWVSRRGSRRERLEAVSKYLEDILKATRTDTDHSVLPALQQVDSGFGRPVELLWGLNEYNILPDVARAPSEPSPYALMRHDGAGVSEVIHALSEGMFAKLEDSRHLDLDYVGYYKRRRVYYPNQWYGPRYIFPREVGRSHGLDKALENIKEQLVAAVRPIDGIATRLDYNTGKRFVVFASGTNSFLPSEVSDGTIKWLCILVSLFVPRSLIYLLEEPENFLHPWMQQRLVSTMRDQAREHETVFFLSSHSTTVLNAATPDEVLVVTPSLNGTQIERIRNREEIETVLMDSQFGLGDLWVSGAIDGVPQ